MATVVGQGRVISNFALTHFAAATRFQAVVNRLEAEHAGQEFGPFFVDIAAYCASCIVMSAASLEALINEVYLTPGPLHDEIDNFETFFWGGGALERRWFFLKRKVSVRGLERTSALQKYRKAVVILGKEPLSKMDPQYENAEVLFGLRNHLIHFKPLWEDNRRNQVLERALDGRFELSPFVDEGAEFLAKKCMSGGCAAWAVRTVAEFVRYFGERTGLFPKKLGSFRLDDFGPG